MPSVSLIAAGYVLGPVAVIQTLNQPFPFPEAFFKARAAQLSEMPVGTLLFQTGCRYLHHCLLNSLGSTRTLVVIGKYVCEQRINHQGLDFFLYIFPKHRLKIVIDYFPLIYMSPTRAVHIDDTCSPSRICVVALHTPPPSRWQHSKCVFFCYSPQGEHSLVLHVVSLCVRSWVWEKWLSNGLSEIIVTCFSSPALKLQNVLQHWSLLPPAEFSFKQQCWVKLPANEPTVESNLCQLKRSLNEVLGAFKCLCSQYATV